VGEVYVSIQHRVYSNIASKKVTRYFEEASVREASLFEKEKS